MPPLLHNPKKQISKISDNLFVCGLSAVTPNEVLKRGITLMIDVSNPLVDDDRAKSIPGVRVHRVNIIDFEDVVISDYFHEVSTIIAEEISNGGKVLIFCYMGVSRSVSLCLAYLVGIEKMDLKSAFLAVKSARNVAKPNSEFWKQLIQYEMSELGSISVRMRGNSFDCRFWKAEKKRAKRCRSFGDFSS